MKWCTYGPPQLRQPHQVQILDKLAGGTGGWMDVGWVDGVCGWMVVSGTGGWMVEGGW